MIKTIVGLLYIFFLTVDALQTRTISNDSRFWETNPILGRSPSMRRIAVYFSVWGLLVLIVGTLLPEPLSIIFLSFSLGFEVAFVLGNHWRGITI